VELVIPLIDPAKITLADGLFVPGVDLLELIQLGIQ
jgi:hypothetical protein